MSQHAGTRQYHPTAATEGLTTFSNEDTESTSYPHLEVDSLVKHLEEEEEEEEEEDDEEDSEEESDDKRNPFDEPTSFVRIAPQSAVQINNHHPESQPQPQPHPSRAADQPVLMNGTSSPHIQSNGAFTFPHHQPHQSQPHHDQPQKVSPHLNHHNYYKVRKVENDSSEAAATTEEQLSEQRLKPIVINGGYRPSRSVKSAAHQASKEAVEAGQSTQVETELTDSQVIPVSSSQEPRPPSPTLPTQVQPLQPLQPPQRLTDDQNHQQLPSKLHQQPQHSRPKLHSSTHKPRSPYLRSHLRNSSLNSQRTSKLNNISSSSSSSTLAPTPLSTDPQPLESALYRLCLRGRLPSAEKRLLRSHLLRCISYCPLSEKESWGRRRRKRRQLLCAMCPKVRYYDTHSYEHYLRHLVTHLSARVYCPVCHAYVQGSGYLGLVHHLLGTTGSADGAQLNCLDKRIAEEKEEELKALKCSKDNVILGKGEGEGEAEVDGKRSHRRRRELLVELLEESIELGKNWPTLYCAFVFQGVHLDERIFPRASWCTTCRILTDQLTVIPKSLSGNGGSSCGSSGSGSSSSSSGGCSGSDSVQSQSPVNQDEGEVQFDANPGVESSIKVQHLPNHQHPSSQLPPPPLEQPASLKPETIQPPNHLNHNFPHNFSPNLNSLYLNPNHREVVDLRTPPAAFFNHLVQHMFYFRFVCLLCSQRRALEFANPRTLSFKAYREVSISFPAFSFVSREHISRFHAHEFRQLPKRKLLFQRFMLVGEIEAALEEHLTGTLFDLRAAEKELYTVEEVGRIISEVHPADPIRFEARTKEVATQWPIDPVEEKRREELIRRMIRTREKKRRRKMAALANLFRADEAAETGFHSANGGLVESGNNQDNDDDASSDASSSLSSTSPWQRYLTHLNRTVQKVTKTAIPLDELFETQPSEVPAQQTRQTNLPTSQAFNHSSAIKQPHNNNCCCCLVNNVDAEKFVNRKVLVPRRTSIVNACNGILDENSSPSELSEKAEQSDKPNSSAFELEKEDAASPNSDLSQLHQRIEKLANRLEEVNVVPSTVDNGVENNLV